MSLEKLADPLWRLNHLYKIVDKSGRMVQFKENVPQAILNRSVAQRKMILKSRQIGVSTNELLKKLDGVLFRKNRTACIIAHEQDAIKKLFRIIRRAYDDLEKRGLAPPLDRGGGSLYELRFPSMNSRIYCDLESRGDTIHDLHISEYAFIEDKDRLVATMECVPHEAGTITIESTPFGMNHFFEDWNDSGFPFQKFFFPWFIMPEYRTDPTDSIVRTDEEIELAKKAKKDFKVILSDDQIAFRRLKKSTQKDKFIQEYPEDPYSCFLSSGRNVMDLIKVGALIQNKWTPMSDSAGLLVYEKVDKEKDYVIGCDVAEGVGRDFSVASVFCVQTMRLVAIGAWQSKPFDFAHQVEEIAKLYTTPGPNHPEIAVERNNHGHAVLLELIEHIQYPNVYYGADERPGWKTDLVSRPVLLDTWIDGIENGTIQVGDEKTLQECMTLVEINGKIQANTGKLDDRIFACGIAVQRAINLAPNADLYENIEKRIFI